jgi:hypothetical protein
MCEECKISREYKALRDLESEVSEGKVVCAYPSTDKTYLVFKRGDKYMNMYETKDEEKWYRKWVKDESFDSLLYTMYMMQECDCERDAIWFVVDTLKHEKCRTCKVLSGYSLKDGRCLWCRKDKEREAFNNLLGDIEIDL